MAMVAGRSHDQERNYVSDEVCLSLCQSPMPFEARFARHLVILELASYVVFLRTICWCSGMK